MGRWKGFFSVVLLLFLTGASIGISGAAEASEKSEDPATAEALEARIQELLKLLIEQSRQIELKKQRLLLSRSREPGGTTTNHAGETQIAALNVPKTEANQRIGLPTSPSPTKATSAIPVTTMAARVAELEKTVADQTALLAAMVALLEQERAAHSAAAESMSGAGPANAADPAEQQEDIEAGRAAEEKEIYLPSRSWRAGFAYGGKDVPMETHVFIDLEYIDAEKDGSRSGVSTFDNHHANVFFDARIRPNLRGHVEIEYEHSGESIETDAAYLAWDIAKWISLDAGRFYTPFGIERFVWYSPTNQLITRSTAMRQIIPGTFYANGLLFRGNVGPNEKHRFTYEAALSDGLGADAATDRRGSRQVRDNNSSRAVSGRVSYSLWPYVEVGTSFHTQRYADSENLDITFVGFDLAARWRGFELRSEYVASEVERGVVLDPNGTTIARLEGEDLKQNGMYAQLSYTFSSERDFLPTITLVTRYDSVDLDELITGNNDQDLWSFGFNLGLYEHLRLKSEYQRIDEKGTSRDDDVYLAQFVIDY